MERPRVIGKVRATYDYESVGEDELTLVGGRVYELIEKDASGWWKARDGERVGVFPSNFVEEIPDEKGKAAAAVAPRRSLELRRSDSSSSSASVAIADVEMIRVAPSDNSVKALIPPERAKPKNPALGRSALVSSGEPPLWMRRIESSPNWPEFLTDIASDEVLMNIFGYLDDKSLLRCACVCKRFQTVTEDRRLWVRHNRKKFKKSRDPRLHVEGKQFFLLEMKKAFAAAQERRRADRERQEAMMERMWREEVAENWWWPTQLCCHCNIYDIIMVLLFLLFGIFIALRADGKIAWRWALVAIPLFIFSAILIIRSISFLIPQVRIVVQKDNDDSDSFTSLSSVSEHYMAVEVVDYSEENRQPWRVRYPVLAWSIIMFTACGVFLLLICLRMSGVDISARVIIIPLLVAYLAVILHFIWLWFLNKEWILPALVLFVVLPWIIYAILIALKLDGTLNRSWIIVQIPSWIGMFLSAILPALWMGFENGAGEFFWGLLIGAGIICCPIGPIVAFQVLYALKLDGDLTSAAWRAVFAPFFVIMAMACCGVLMLHAIRLWGNEMFGGDD